jgi:hypothetical protein
MDDPETVIANWMEWVRARGAAGEWQQLEASRFAMLRGLRARGLWSDADQLASEIWELLGGIQSPEAQRARAPWDWERFNPFGAIEQKDWAAAEDIMHREIAARRVEGAAGWSAVVVAGRGIPTPPEIMQAIEEKGVESVDEYGMFGWYLVAREAAAAGDASQAFDALRKAQAYWTNPPYGITNLWEQDAYWGDLRNRPEFKQAFDERRQRIGPVCGMLHYFPGW